MKQQAIDIAKTLPGNIIARAMNKTVHIGMTFTGSTKKDLLQLLSDGEEFRHKIKAEDYAELLRELQSERELKNKKAITAYITAFPIDQQMLMALTFKEAQKFVDSDPRRAEAMLKAAKFPASAFMWL